MPLTPSQIKFDFWLSYHLFGCPWRISMSAYCWKLEKDDKFWGKFWRPKVDKFMLWYEKQEDHCHRAWKHDMHALGQPAE